MNHVLVLDADQTARRRGMAAVRYGGFEATGARSVDDACRLLRRHSYAAILVDPGDGSDAPAVVERLRTLTQVPIVAVSASAEQSYKVSLLDAGADDYMTRPVDPDELLARLRAVARRVPSAEPSPIVTPHFTMHLADRRLLRDGHEVPLSPTEWRLIEVLVQHRGHLVTREDLLVSVWGPEAADKTQYLRVHMASIRRKVEPVPSHPRYFVTIPGLGLRFEVPANDGARAQDGSATTRTRDVDHPSPAASA